MISQAKGEFIDFWNGVSHAADKTIDYCFHEVCHRLPPFLKRLHKKVVFILYK